MYTDIQNKHEWAAAVTEAVVAEDYLTLENYAQHFAKHDDMETAEWLRGLAKEAYDAAWAYDRYTDEALIDSMHS